MRIQKGEKPFSCCECGKRINYQCVLDRHRMIHTVEKPFSCCECGIRFTQQQHLITHTDSHRRETFTCGEGGKRFDNQNFLQRYRRIHTGEKSFSCLKCGQIFSLQQDLIRHTKIRTGEKGLCTQERNSFVAGCEKTFNRRVTLNKHKCDRCNTSASS